MTHVGREFWLFVISLLVGIVALGLVVLFFFFPDDLYPVGSVIHVLTAVVAAGGLGAVGWRVTRGQTPLFDGVGGE